MDQNTNRSVVVDIVPDDDRTTARTGLARTRRRIASTSVLVSTLLLGAVLAAPATAAGDAATAAATAPAASRVVGAAENARALQYWTPERMRTSQVAEPGLRGGSAGPVAPVERGQHVQVAPAPRDLAAKAPVDATTTGQSTATATTTAATASEGYWQASNTANPNAQIGRLFYQQWDSVSRIWKNYNCSGTVVNSENKSVVWTAGHCVFQTHSNTWNRNYTFCPGYRNGVCPFGQWTPSTQHTTSQWQSSVCSADGRCMPQEFLYDLGALKMNAINGTRIANWVGSHGIQFNGATYQHRYAFGYPLNKSNGEYMYYCAGNNTYVSGNLRIACTAGPGASGGPWLSQINGAWLGVVHSVNSHGGSTYMAGPYQGTVAQQLFSSVRY